MNQAPVEQTASLYVGTVEFVSPDQLKVAVDVDAPESVALNAGTPRPFPRVIKEDNSILTLPSDVAQAWLPEESTEAGGPLL